MIRFYLYKQGSFLLDESVTLDRASPHLDEGIWLSVIDAMKIKTLDHSRLVIPIRFTASHQSPYNMQKYLTDSDKIIVWICDNNNSVRYKATVKNVILHSTVWFLTADFSIQSIESLSIGD